MSIRNIQQRQPYKKKKGVRSTFERLLLLKKGKKQQKTATQKMGTYKIKKKKTNGLKAAEPRKNFYNREQFKKEAKKERQQKKQRRALPALKIPTFITGLVPRAGMSSTEKRMTMITLGIMMLFIAVGARLVLLQIVRHSAYDALAEGQHVYFENLMPKRGQIYMQDKFADQPVAIATNEKRFFLFAVPRDVENIDTTFQKLKDILQLDEQQQEDIKKRLDKKSEGDQYEPIQHFVSQAQKEQLEEENLTGLRFVVEQKRFYPEQELGAHLLGFVSVQEDEQKGKYGLEGYYNEELTGQKGKIEAFLDTAGNWMTSSKRDIQPAIDGAGLVLSIDRNIQFAIEQELKRGIETYGAEAGEIIVQDPETGAILAMASFPTFDPNKYRETEEVSTFLNRGVQATYESGSVIKAFTAAIAVNEGVATPNSTYTDTGSATLNGWTIKNSDGKAHGVRTLTEVLELSLNTGTIHFQNLAGKDAFEEYMLKFGFTKPTGIDLTGETKGNLDNLTNKKSDINYATMSYGQGMSVTPVGLLNAFSSLVNGGNLYQPYVVKEFKKADGTIEAIPRAEPKKMITESTSLKMRGMLGSVVKNGHAEKAQVQGYTTGGKTGTANIPETGGYSEETNHTFIGFGPIEEPKFSMLVRYQRPKNAIYSASTSAESFGIISKYLFDYYEIPPEK